MEQIILGLNFLLWTWEIVAVVHIFRNNTTVIIPFKFFIRGWCLIFSILKIQLCHLIFNKDHSILYNILFSKNHWTTFQKESLFCSTSPWVSSVFSIPSLLWTFSCWKSWIFFLGYIILFNFIIGTWCCLLIISII